MQSVITIFFIALMVLISAISEKSWSNPLTIFCGMWFAICFLAELKLFGMYDYSENVFLIVLLGNIGFFCGYMLAKKTKVISRYEFSAIGISNKYLYQYNTKIIMAFLWAAIAIYLLMSIQVLGLLLAGFDTATIRESYRETGTTTVSGMALTAIFGSTLVKQLELYIAQPVMRAAIPIFAIEITGKGKMTPLATMALAVAGLYTFSKFGRFALLYIIADVILCYFIIGKNIDRRTKKKIKRVVLLGIVGICLVLVYLSVYRWENETFSYAQSIYGYFSIPIPLLDFWTKRIDAVNAYSFGNSYVLGFMGFVTRVLKRVGISLPAYATATLYNYNLVDSFVYIFPGQKYNAYVSMFFAFYLDFREIGVFAGTLIFGYIVEKSYKKAKTKRVEYLAFYLLLIQCIVKSFVRWEFVLEQYWLSFLILRLWFKKERVDESDV